MPMSLGDNTDDVRRDDTPCVTPNSRTPEPHSPLARPHPEQLCLFVFPAGAASRPRGGGDTTLSAKGHHSGRVREPLWAVQNASRWVCCIPCGALRRRPTRTRARARTHGGLRATQGPGVTPPTGGQPRSRGVCRRHGRCRHLCAPGRPSRYREGPSPVGFTSCFQEAGGGQRLLSCLCPLSAVAPK